MCVRVCVLYHFYIIYIHIKKSKYLKIISLRSIEDSDEKAKKYSEIHFHGHFVYKKRVYYS